MALLGAVPVPKQLNQVTMSRALSDYQPATDCLAGKNIMITGATGGLGSALAKRAAKLGATVVLAGRNLPALEQLYDEIEADKGAQPAIFPVDQQNATQQNYAELATTIEKELGQLHALVHCAVQLGMPTQIEHYPVEMWASVMSVNVNSAFLLSRALLPLLNNTGNASIVFTTDDRSSAFWGAYGVSKAALTTLASILADEIEGKTDQNNVPKVCVNTVNPGPMRTRLRAMSFAGELPAESPEPATKTDALIYLIAREDPALHGKLIAL